MFTVFAIYQLPKRRKLAQFVGLSALYFEGRYRNNNFKIPLHEVAKVILEKRRKLAPLVIGGIITSLSLLSILLFSSSLEVVGLAAFGLLLTYYGVEEYVVMHIEHANTTTLIWLPKKVAIASIRPFVALLEFYLSRQYFPVIFASSTRNITPQLIHYESTSVAAHSSIIYSFRNDQISHSQPIAVNPALLDAPIIIDGANNIIGKSDYLINQRALVEQNTASYS